MGTTIGGVRDNIYTRVSGKYALLALQNSKYTQIQIILAQIRCHSFDKFCVVTLWPVCVSSWQTNVSTQLIDIFDARLLFLIYVRLRLLEPENLFFHRILFLNTGSLCYYINTRAECTSEHSATALNSCVFDSRTFFWPQLYCIDHWCVHLIIIRNSQLILN